MKLGILGSGSWGTALSILYATNGAQVYLYTRSAEVCFSINENHKNPRYLSEFNLPANIRASIDLREVVSLSELLILAVPSTAVESVAERLKGLVKDIPIVSGTKGYVFPNARRVTQVLREYLGDSYPVGVLSGPNFAVEVASLKPTAAVFAIEDINLSRKIARVLSCPSYRVYSSTDIVGAEHAGAMKNVIAIAAGISDALGMGDNARAALITRGLAEMVRLGLAYNANPLTYAGLAGVGDLVLTCSGQKSRNYTLGYLVARGIGVEDALHKLGMVAEGYYTVPAALEMAEKLGIELPITQHVHKVLFDHLPVREVAMDLLDRELKDEFET
jgi:glycerol-3-phosphate dehydrogenase (NAD(P)+)